MVQGHGSSQLIVFAEDFVSKLRLISDVYCFYFLQILVYDLIFFLFPQLIALNIF